MILVIRVVFERIVIRFSDVLRERVITYGAELPSPQVS